MRQVILDLQASKIREVANAGMGRSDVLAFWFGESDEVTPAFIRQAAIDSLQRGETFYAQNLGLPELREAIAQYMTQAHGALSGGAERIAVTSSGVSALMLAMQALIDAGDEVVAVTPVWPNLTAQPQILGARLRCVSLVPKLGAWTLDMDALLGAVTPTTKLLIVNAPNNPTGWTLTRAEQQRILAHCRRTGTWIVADEVYERLYYGDPTQTADTAEVTEARKLAETVETTETTDCSENRSYLASSNEAYRPISSSICAPSFLDVAQADDRLVVAHSFSKSFLMTGWRLGWLVCPPAMTPHIGKLIEFNTSCASVFTQRAALAALAGAAQVTPPLVAHLKICRDTLVEALRTLPGVSVAAMPGGMYAFFQIAGYSDSLALAKRLVAEAGLGLAPGVAFAPEADGWLRWCFASKDLQRLRDGVGRLRAWLLRQG